MGSEGKLVVGLILGGTALVVLANILPAQESVLHVSTFSVTLLGKYLTYALLALALDLVCGCYGHVG